MAQCLGHLAFWHDRAAGAALRRALDTDCQDVLFQVMNALLLSKPCACGYDHGYNAHGYPSGYHAAAPAGAHSAECSTRQVRGVDPPSSARAELG